MTKPKSKSAEPSFEREPPHDTSAERAVLGACLLDPAALYRVRERGLLHSSFYVPAHQHIFAAMETIMAREDKLDSVLLCAELNSAGMLEAVGAASYVAGLTSAVPTSVNADKYAQQVIDCALRRSLIIECMSAIEACYRRQDGRSHAAELLLRVEGLCSDVHRAGVQTPADLAREFEAHLETSGPVTPGVSTGIFELDTYLRGIGRQQLWVIGGRPSAGKSAFLLNLAYHTARDYGPVFLASMDATKQEIMHRLSYIVCPTDAFDDCYRAGDREGKTGLISTFLPRVTRLPIYMNDEALYVEDWIYIWKAHLMRHPNTQWIGVDYVQQMQTRRPYKNRLEALNGILTALKKFRMETEIPIVLLSQVNREKAGPYEKPTLANLKDSGNIEQDAHVVILLSDLDPKEKENNIEGLGWPVRVDIAKQKDGPRKELKLRFIKQQYVFASLRKPRDDGVKDANLFEAAATSGDESCPF